MGLEETLAVAVVMPIVTLVLGYWLGRRRDKAAKRYDEMVVATSRYLEQGYKCLGCFGEYDKSGAAREKRELMLRGEKLAFFLSDETRASVEKSTDTYNSLLSKWCGGKDPELDAHRHWQKELSTLEEKLREKVHAK